MRVTRHGQLSDQVGSDLARRDRPSHLDHLAVEVLTVIDSLEGGDLLGQGLDGPVRTRALRSSKRATWYTPGACWSTPKSSQDSISWARSSRASGTLFHAVQCEGRFGPEVVIAVPVLALYGGGIAS